jgi:hypothetical protein
MIITDKEHKHVDLKDFRLKHGLRPRLLVEQAQKQF